MKNVYLIGFMGTGKTTVGKLIAKALNKVFLEMDEEIEREQAMPISEIFSRFGEAHFRKLEGQLLARISQRQDLVVSCGGGLACDQENLNTLKATGFVICLEASSRTIYERVRSSTHRPLLQVKEPQHAIEELLKKRQGCYRQADFTIDTEASTPEQVVAEAIKVINA